MNQGLVKPSGGSQTKLHSHVVLVRPRIPFAHRTLFIGGAACHEASSCSLDITTPVPHPTLTIQGVVRSQNPVLINSFL